MLTAEAIEKIEDFELRRVEVPEWRGHVYVRSLTAGARDKFVALCIDQKTGSVRTDMQNVTATLLAMTVCDAKGRLLYQSFEQGRGVFAAKSAAACSLLFDVATELNKLTERDIEELVTDFPATTSGDSGTGSQSRSAGASPKSTAK